MKNVLFILYYFPPMGGSGVQRPLKFAKYLRDYGWNPIILCPEPGLYHTFDESLKKELDSLGLDIYRVKGNTPFHFTKRKNLKLPSKVEHILRSISTFFWLPDNKKGWINPAIEKAREIINTKKVDLIFSTAPPYSNLIIADRLKREFKIPTIFDFRDEWLESHLIKYHSKWHFRKMQNIEEETLSRVDIVVSINKYISNSIFSRYPKLKIATVSQGFDPEDFSLQETKSVKEKISNKCVFLYSGTFYPKGGLEYFLKAVKELIQEFPEISKKIQLQFQGNLPPNFDVLIGKFNLERITKKFGYLPHGKAIKNLNNANILWLLNDHTQNSKIISLGKTYEYMASNKPILGLTFESDLRDTLLSYNCSYICNPFSISDIKEQITALLKDWENNSFPEVNKEFVRQFDRRLLTKKLVQIFNAISS